MRSKTFLIAALIGFIVFGCGFNRKIEQGNEVAAKVEKFKKEKGRLPDSLTEIGILETEEGPIYYEKRSESKYILWFGKELGESATYDSETKKWK